MVKTGSTTFQLSPVIVYNPVGLPSGRYKHWTDILLVLTQLSLAKVAAGDSQLNTRWLK